ncbi:MAG TPA: threonine synthase, partial [Candidatus Accumulibacter sp.]|nr:threonine synthase [Accumulibacter sp.]
MRYLSTRGSTSSSRDSAGPTFTEILLGGLAPDGGLYLPESYPQVDAAELDQWRRLSYADLAFAVLAKFIDDIPPADLKALVTRTYAPRVYCNGRSETQASEITPLRWLERPNAARG